MTPIDTVRQATKNACIDTYIERLGPYGERVRTFLDRTPGFPEKVRQGDKDAVVMLMSRLAKGLLEKAGLGAEHEELFIEIVRANLDDAKLAGVKAAVPVWLAKTEAAIRAVALTPNDAPKALRTPARTSRRRLQFGTASPTAPVELPSRDSSVPFLLTWQSDDLNLKVIVQRSGEELVATVHLGGADGGETVRIALFGFDTSVSILKSIDMAEQDQARTGRASLGNLDDIRKQIGTQVSLIGFLQKPIPAILESTSQQATKNACIDTYIERLGPYGERVRTFLDRTPGFPEKVRQGDKDAVVMLMSRLAKGLLEKAGLGAEHEELFIEIVRANLDDAKLVGVKAAVPVWLAKTEAAIHAP